MKIEREEIDPICPHCEMRVTRLIQVSETVNSRIVRTNPQREKLGGAVRAIDPMIQELANEATTTQRLLERVPADKLAWKPHEKSMTLGQLAYHVATAAGDLSGFLEMSELDGSTVDFATREPETKEEILQAFTEGMEMARQRMEALDDARAMETWTLKFGNQVAMALPKIGLVRVLMLNHWYHHRGQLTVYLRMLDVPLPATYGVSADENPFADMMKAAARTA
jgi:uncharacterized damage-inducible protein DinB